MRKTCTQSPYQISPLGEPRALETQDGRTHRLRHSIAISTRRLNATRHQHSAAQDAAHTVGLRHVTHTPLTVPQAPARQRQGLGKPQQNSPTARQRPARQRTRSPTKIATLPSHSTRRPLTRSPSPHTAQREQDTHTKSPQSIEVPDHAQRATKPLAANTTAMPGSPHHRSPARLPHNKPMPISAPRATNPTRPSPSTRHAQEGGRDTVGQEARRCQPSPTRRGPDWLKVSCTSHAVIQWVPRTSRAADSLRRHPVPLSRSSVHISVCPGVPSRPGRQDGNLVHLLAKMDTSTTDTPVSAQDAHPHALWSSTVG